MNTLKKWDQAFRVYASIYSRANPHRSHEIWQYVHVIMTAASHYIWENVAEYDVTFCQLMAAYPHRNWGKIYNQMWNLAMKEPVQCTSNYRLGGQGSHAAGHKEGRDKYCWKFNKNKCKKKNCEWEHHCKFCDAWGHGVYNCFKKLAAKN